MMSTRSPGDDTQTLHLPADLGALTGADLAELNAQLRAGALRVDWGAVEIAPAAALDELLLGLQADRDADALGAHTLSEALATAVVEALGRVSSSQASPLPAPEPEPSRRQRRPAVFTSGVDPAAAAVDSPSGNHEPEPEPEPDALPESPVLLAPTPAELRDRFVEHVAADLLGPVGGPTEEVTTPVTDRYILGKLAPQATLLSTRPDPPEEEDPKDAAEAAGSAYRIAPEMLTPDPVGDEGGDEGPAEPAATGPRPTYPSSLGFSFTVDAAVTEIEVSARWGRYERIESDTLHTEEGTPRRVWRREPRGGSLRLPLAVGEIDARQPDPQVPGVAITGRVRQRHGGDWAVTLFMHNHQPNPKTNRAAAWLFQAGLTARGVDGAAAFVRRPLPGRPRGGPEARALEMRYRNDREFAVGHGIGVDWDLAAEDLACATAVRTVAIPAFELPRFDAPRPEDVPGLEGVELGMAELGALDGPAAAAALQPLADAYARWIARLDVQRHTDPSLDQHQPAAMEAITTCRAAHARIEAGIATIRDDPAAAVAFAGMNQAMAEQRVHSLYAAARRDNPGATLAEFDTPGNRRWRPFQIAFILLSVPALARLDHPDRAATPGDDGDPLAVADLLWFPTGGGKTEAYLGLAAFAMAVRRLQPAIPGYEKHAGLSVLMRYTLRLLTLQQFQRATALICAMELQRQAARAAGDLRWGDEPFRIGLWVGARMTPNRNSHSAEAVKKLRAGDAPGGGSPAQLTHCPWCGAAIDPRRDIDVETYEAGRCVTIMYCGDVLGGCPFSRKAAPGRGLPVVVVDEEIYRRPPSLLIATVDKFAQMPWRGATAALFGRVDGLCDRHGYKSLDPDLAEATFHPKLRSLPTARVSPAGPLRPPDLIIQDELHLISGPIGSMVGLYETAIDALSTFEVDGARVRPKVIASTATIRQASEQINALFLRRAEIFPPQGLDASDNFFAEQVPLAGPRGLPGRQYLGVLARGERLKAVLIRVYVAALAAAQTLYAQYGQAADPYMTLVGYFGSMRELGGTRRLVDDDIKARLMKIDERGLERRSNLNVQELTSRVSSSDIPKVLGALNVPFNPATEKQQRTKKGGQQPIDVLLATNMVSVGVDVPRLGLMVVDGQPKTTAEYIQATSRVGRERDRPGVVITVYNWARPRDLSHFERFRHSHATFYQQVEALSVTPFSSGAIDRGLSGLLASLVRLGTAPLVPNAGAGVFRPDLPAVQAAVDQIRQRAARLAPHTQKELESQLQSRLDDWAALADAGAGRLGYQADAEHVPLLRAPDGGAWEPFTCLNSLRDVEATVNLVLVDNWSDDAHLGKGGPA